MLQRSLHVAAELTDWSQEDSLHFGFLLISCRNPRTDWNICTDHVCHGMHIKSVLSSTAKRTQAPYA